MMYWCCAAAEIRRSADVMLPGLIQYHNLATVQRERVCAEIQPILPSTAPVLVQPIV